MGPIVRLLAHGSGARAERARIGSWPEIPGGLLLDGRGLGPGAPAFGLGTVQGRPVLVYREPRDDDGGMAVRSFLLEPRTEDFERFHWNAGWLLASLLADASGRRLLLEEPEAATVEALATLLERCAPHPLPATRAPEALVGLLARAALEPARFAITRERAIPESAATPIGFAAVLEGVPVALRTGRGWLVGGLESHAEILGCALLLGQAAGAPADPRPGLATLARLERLAGSNAAVAELLATPRWDWGARGQGLIHSMGILERVESGAVPELDLLGSVPAREGPLSAEIRSAALRTIDESSGPLGFAPTLLLLDEAEAGRRPLSAATVERLDRGALLHHFSERGIPPGPWPEWIVLSPSLKAETWTRLIASAREGWAVLAMRALEDLAPGGARSEAGLGVILAGIQVARERGGSPLDWESAGASPCYPELRPLLAQWARENVLRMRGDWQAAYLVLGDDPGGRLLARGNVPAPVAGRLVMAVREALDGPRAAIARAWLQALATSPLRESVPIVAKLELPGTAGGPWAALETLRRAYEGIALKVAAAPPNERPFLLRELDTLAQHAPAGAPDLAALELILGGELPERTLRAVSRWNRGAGAERRGAGWLAGITARLGGGRRRVEERPAGQPPAEKRAAEVRPLAPPDTQPRPTPTLAGSPAAAPIAGSNVEPPPIPGAPAVTGAEPPRRGEPVPPPAQEPAAPTAREPAPAPAAAPEYQAPPDLDLCLHEWIVGGGVEDDRRGDREMIRLFEQGGTSDLQVARTALQGFSRGILYRLAGRAALNARLLDGLARACDGAMLDRIVCDAARYDAQQFARDAAVRLRRAHAGGVPGPVDEAILRLLSEGPAEVRDNLARELRACDAELLAELTRSG